MKLFKYLTVASVVQGGAMFAANEEERNCIRECKNARDCRGEAASDENDQPALCVLQCREECFPRKSLLRSHFSPDKRQRHADKKHQKQIDRISARILKKQANPPPYMKRLTELIESNELPARMTNSLRECLENQKLILECQGQGKEFWPCKREVVSTCLEKVNYFDGLSVEDAAELVKDIENNAENMIAAIEEMEAAESMQMDMGIEEDPEAVKQMLHEAIKTDGRLEDKVDLSAALERIKFKPVFETRDQAVEEEESSEYEDEGPEYEAEESSEYEGEEPEYEAEESSEYEGEESSESSEIKHLFDEGVGNRWSYEEKPEFEAVEDIEPRFEEVEEVESRFEEVEEVEIIRQEPEEKVEAVFSIRSKNNNGQPGSQKIKHKHQFYAAMADDLTHEELVNAMCSCRTSMEPMRINNYLKNHGVISEWEHHEDSCKWCVYSKSKKCSNCLKYWEAQEGVEAVSVANNCQIYKEALRNDKIDFSMPQPDPCPMKNLHNGKFNEYQKEGELAANYESFKALYKNGGNMPNPAH